MLLMAEEEFSTQTSTLVAQGLNDLTLRLATISRGRNVPPVEGPVRIGSYASITEPASVEILAAHYQLSLEANRRAFPYFSETERLP